MAGAGGHLVFSGVFMGKYCCSAFLMLGNYCQQTLYNDLAGGHLKTETLCVLVALILIPYQQYIQTLCHPQSF
jgi:hypothetical protein